MTDDSSGDVANLEALRLKLTRENDADPAAYPRLPEPLALIRP